MIIKKVTTTLLLLVSTNLYSQEIDLLTDVIDIGDYGVSLNEKKIGKKIQYDCSTDEYHADCYGYLDDSRINFNTTKMYVLNGEIYFEEDFPYDLQTFKVIQSGDNQYTNSKPSIYVDKENIYVNTSGYIKQFPLLGYTHVDGLFFIKDKQLGYFNDIRIEKVRYDIVVNLPTFKAIYKNLFYDKNSVYYKDNVGQLKKIDGIDDTSDLNIVIDKDYIIIDDMVFLAGWRIQEDSLLNLDAHNVQKLTFGKYRPELYLFDKEHTYYKGFTGGLNNIDCEDKDEKEYQLACLVEDLNSLALIRKTLTHNYLYDQDNKTLYFDARLAENSTAYSKSIDTKNLISMDGYLYKTANGYYFSNFDQYSMMVKNVKIWNSKTDNYEDLDLSQYHYFNGDSYWYKGVLYTNHSSVLDDNFTIRNARELNTLNYHYILNNDKILNVVDTNNLNLNSIKVLNLKNGTPSNYLIGDNFIIYDGEVINDISLDNVQVLTADLLKVNDALIIRNLIYPTKDFPEIIILD